MVGILGVIDRGRCCFPIHEGLLDVKLGLGDCRPGLSTKTGAWRWFDACLSDPEAEVDAMMSVSLFVFEE